MGLGVSLRRECRGQEEVAGRCAVQKHQEEHKALNLEWEKLLGSSAGESVLVREHSFTETVLGTGQPRVKGKSRSGSLIPNKSKLRVCQKPSCVQKAKTPGANLKLFRTEVSARTS